MTFHFTSWSCLKSQLQGFNASSLGVHAATCCAAPSTPTAHRRKARDAQTSSMSAWRIQQAKAAGPPTLRCILHAHDALGAYAQSPIKQICNCARALEAAAHENKAFPVTCLLSLVFESDRSPESDSSLFSNPFDCSCMVQRISKSVF